MKQFNAVLLACVLTGAANIVRGQDQSTNQFVSKEDYLKLKAEHDQLKQQLNALQAQIEQLLKKTAPPETEAVKAQIQDLQKKGAAQQAETDQALGDLEKKVDAVKQMAKDSFPGTTKMLLAGYGSGTVTATSKGYGPSQPPEETPAAGDRPGRNFFTATFNPIFLWKVSDQLLFEGELEVELEGSEASVALEMAHLSYVANDYLTISAGKFLNPMDYFVERQHMAWVNKMPDKPLAVYDGLFPESLLGLQVRGGIPVGPTKFGYSFYIANAPSLTTSAADPSRPIEVGTLGFDNFDNVGNHVAVGGRLGFYPIPELEVGYGFQVADVGSGANAVFHSADLTYVRESPRLMGTINLHAQWVWSDIDRTTFDVGNGPFSFNNSRNGGYVQLAYRPTRLEQPILKNLEPVFRYDVINQKNTPVGFDEQRYTIGLDYWLGPSTVAKIAYEWDRQNGTGQNGQAFMLQFALGF